MDACFECESTDEIHHHHIVPRSVGGTKTIPLCGRCHGLVHGRRTMNTSELTRAAIARKRSLGLRTSRDVPYGFGLADDGDTLIVDPDETRAVQRIKELRRIGVSIREVCERLTAEGFRPRGKRWHPTTVNRIIFDKRVVVISP